MPSLHADLSLSRCALAATLLLALAACASDPARDAAKAPAAAASAPGSQLAQNCRREFPIGSSIPVTRCGPAEDGGRTVQQQIEDLPKTGGRAMSSQ